jgi:hypothetical protein
LKQDNTIRLSIYAQRFLIRTMYLVGATRHFISKPFIFKGVFAILDLPDSTVSPTLWRQIFPKRTFVPQTACQIAYNGFGAKPIA